VTATARNGKALSTAVSRGRIAPVDVRLQQLGSLSAVPLGEQLRQAREA